MRFRIPPIKFLRYVCFFLACGYSLGSFGQKPTVAESKLYQLLMQYRKQHGLYTIPLSAKLTQVAQAHVKDLNNYHQLSDSCNMHSWSANGNWTACCYKSNHSNPGCMWGKPAEIAGYKGKGYEIAYVCTASATPQEALKGWQQSGGHNQVVLNQGMWASSRWKAMGVGIYKGYAVVWFGEETDE